MIVWPGLRRSVSAISRLFNSAAFDAPLTHSAIPTRAASGTTGTFTRATTATVRDNEGVLRTVPAGCARFEGARRVYNQWSVASEPTSSTGYHTATNVTFDSGISGFAGSAYFADASVTRTLRPLANSAALNRTWLVSFYVQRDDGGVPDLNGYDDLTLTLDGSDILSGVTVTLVSGTLYRAVKKWTPTSSQEVIVRKYTGGFNNNNPIRATGFQLEDITGRADQATPSEYVSVGVLSAPYHGSGVDGVKCFPTDISGNQIPSTTLLGYQAQGARTNSIPESQTFDSATWGKNDAACAGGSINAVVAPDGTLTGDKLTEASTTNGQHFAAQSVDLADGSVTFSVYAKAAERSWITLYSGVATHAAWFDVTNGVVGTVGAGLTSATIQDAGNGWWRCSISSTQTGVGAVTRGIYLANADNSNSYVGVVGNGLYLWGAQLELGSFASSYIPTTTLAVARNADVEAVSTSGNIAAAAGSVYLEYTPTHSPSGTIAFWGTYVDASNYTAIIHDATNLIFRKRIAGVNYDATIANAFVSGTTYKACATWGASGTSITLNGTEGTPHANTTAAQIAATMQWGADGNSLQQPFASVRNCRDWLRQLSASERAAVTA